MRFNVYGRFVIEIRRESESWIAYRAEFGKRRRQDDLVIPSDVRSDELATYLDDFYHELARPGQRVQVVP